MRWDSSALGLEDADALNAQLELQSHRPLVLWVPCLLSVFIFAGLHYARPWSLWYFEETTGA